jgi:hypothetical protein
LKKGDLGGFENRHGERIYGKPYNPPAPLKKRGVKYFSLETVFLMRKTVLKPQNNPHFGHLNTP